MSINIETIKNLPGLRDLPSVAVEELSRVCVPRAFKKNETIYLRGGSAGRIFLVLDGEVKLYVAGAGQHIVVQVFKPGEWFGDLTIANHPSMLPPEDYAEATEDTKLCVMSSQDVARLLATYAPFAMVFLVAFRNRLHQAQSKIRDLAISSAPTRLLNELIRYALAHGVERNEWYDIEKRFTHQQLAEIVGMARETVTKTLGELEKQGFISQTQKRRIRLNIKKIVDECVECVNLGTLSRSADM